MRSRRTTLRQVLLVTSALAVIGCTETIGPRRDGLGGLSGPSFALDQWNGTFGQSGRLLIKGFNPTNPHVGDAIIATFYWVGSTNIIDSVTDVLTQPGFPRVGNKYNLVEYVTAGGISMATYVATNVQGFPDGYNAPAQDSILAVRANLRDSVVASGISISSFTGVAAVAVQALGAHRSASGTGSTQTIADPGAISVNAGAHVYTATLSNALVGLDPPAGYTSFVQSDNRFKGGSAFAVQANSGTVDPQWSWFFNSPSTWLATVLALNPAPPPQPIALDQLNGTFGESGRVLIQGFNPTNPHVGDAIVATFSWVGSRNIIDSVTDHLNLVGYPRVGNTYKLIEYTTAGGISMATYVATNVQNFPDARTGGDSILVVRANLSDSVTGGLAMAAYTGVAPTFLHALGAHRSATGSGSSTTVAQPGSIAIDSGALAYTATLSDARVGLGPPTGFSSFIQTDAIFKGGSAFAVQGSAGTINPGWTWFFSTQSTWLANVLALNGR